MKEKLTLKKSGREVMPFNAVNKHQRTWSNTHTRVLIPTVPSDNTDKPFHIQIVRNDNLVVVKGGTCV